MCAPTCLNLSLELGCGAIYAWFEPAEDEVQDDTDNCAGSDRRPTVWEDALEQGDGQEAIGITNVTADTDYQDDGADGQLLWIIQVDFFSHHKRNTLHTNDTEQVDGETTSNCGWDGVDGVFEWADEAQDDGDRASGYQYWAGVVAGDDHQGVVLTIVGTSGGAEDTIDQVIETIEHQVQADVAGKEIFLAALFFSQVVNIQGDLIQVGGGFRDGGDSHDTNTDQNGDGQRIVENWEGNAWCGDEVG